MNCPPNTAIIDLDQFPFSKELAEDLVLGSREETIRSKAMVDYFQKVIPFSISKETIEGEVKRHIRNPGGGISCFSKNSQSIFLVTYSSQEIGAAKRVAETHHGIDPALFEWDLKMSDIVKNHTMYSRLTMLQMPDTRITEFGDLYVQLPYLIYAGIERSTFAKMAPMGGSSYFLYQFAETCLQDVLVGHPFCHGAASLYLTDDRNFAGFEGATLAIEAQYILRKRMEFRLNPHGLNDTLVPIKLMRSAILSSLRDQRPENEDRTPEGFSAGRLIYNKKEDAVKKLKTIRDLYYEGAFQEFPQATILARNVIGSALLMCPSAMMDDLQVHPTVAPIAQRQARP